MQCHPAQTTDRTHVLEIVVARTDQPSGLASAAAHFIADNPAVRLHLTLHAFARPNQVGIDGGAAHNYTGETWQLTTVALGNPPVDLNDVFVDSTGAAAPTQLPDSYETESGIKRIHGVLNVVSNGNGHDDYIVQAIWEPTPGGPRMDDAEWAELTALCQLRGPDQPLRLSC